MPGALSTIWLPLLVLWLLVAGAAGWWWRHKRAAAREDGATRSALSTVQAPSADPATASQPQAALVLGSVERKAYRLLREAFPRAEVLAHVQLLRFIRLPPREQRESWLQGAGVLDVDLLLCDGRFRVLSAVDVRTRRDTPSGKQRSVHMERVLKAAGIPVHVWHEESLPSVADIRSTLAPALAARKAQAKATEALNAVADRAADSDAPPGAPGLQSASPATPMLQSASPSTMVGLQSSATHGAAEASTRAPPAASALPLTVEHAALQGRPENR